MGWLEAWQKAREAKFGDAFSYLWIGDADIKRDRDVDEKLRQLNARNRAMGIWSETDYQQSLRNLEAGSIDRQLTNESTSPYGGFKEGAAEGAASMRRAMTGITGTFLSIVPWWGWTVAAGVAAAWIYQTYFANRK